MQNTTQDTIVKEDKTIEPTFTKTKTTTQMLTPSQTSPDSLNKLMNKLEEEGMNKVQQLHKADHTIEDLFKIMSDGGEEFKKHTGRGITYSEMRSMYG